MCTVTFLPVKEGLCLTSSRDEKTLRSQSIPPRIYQYGKITLLFPKDPDAGGTWIAIKDPGNAAVLLNGKIDGRQPSIAPNKSRGLVLLDVLQSDNPLRRFLRFDLNDIAPFVLVLLQHSLLYECSWDGTKKYCKSLSMHKKHIWSSTSLYDEHTITKRKGWFDKWFDHSKNPAAADAFCFHQYAGEGDHRNDIQMNREDLLLTVSITSILLTRSSANMKYLDLKTNTLYNQEWTNNKNDFACNDICRFSSLTKY